jgi:hypothetical protein
MLLMACLAASPAYAGCSNPTANEADVIYNSSYHTYQFCNGTQWIAYGGAGGVGSMNLISTQTASSSASLQWTGLGSGYNTLFLDCTLLPASNVVTSEIQVGEGGTPTWETSNYYSSGYMVDSQDNTGTFDAATYVGGNYRMDNTYGGSFQAWISSVPSTTTYKMIHGLYTNQYSGGSYSQNGWFGGFYHGDTNAVTALRVLLSSGNITSGQCSLYGLNH